MLPRLAKQECQTTEAIAESSITEILKQAFDRYLNEKNPKKKHRLLAPFKEHSVEKGTCTTFSVFYESDCGDIVPVAQ